jgi:hypothetical protein
MCRDCDINEDYPGGQAYSREYREMFGEPTDWRTLYMAEAFAAKDKDIMGDCTVNNNGDIDCSSNRQLSKQQQMEVSQDIFNQFSDQNQERKTKKKAKRGSNNNSAETVFPSGLITLNKNDKFDANSVDPGSVIPSLRNQMPTFMNFPPLGQDNGPPLTTGNPNPLGTLIPSL